MITSITKNDATGNLYNVRISASIRDVLFYRIDNEDFVVKDATGETVIHTPTLETAKLFALQRLWNNALETATDLGSKFISESSELAYQCLDNINKTDDTEVSNFREQGEDE